MKIFSTYVNLWFSFWQKGEDMCCEGFWKRIVTLCLTFWLGVFISDFFALKELPSIDAFDISQKKIVPRNIITDIDSVSGKKVCAPVDANLKYDDLSREAALIPVPNIKVNKNNPQTSEKSVVTKLEKKRKQIEELEKQLYRLSENRFQYQILLHKENCYESNGRK